MKAATTVQSTDMVKRKGCEIMRKKNKKVSPSRNLRLISEKAPFEYVEAYKSLRTNFNFIAMNGKNRRIVVTSTLRDEGKSSVAINLSISLAQAGKKVLLIDADLRNPSLRRYLKLHVDEKIGLSDLLAGEAKVGDCLIETETGFDLIAGGAIPPNPAELISSNAMKSLLDVAAERYDYIICDAPPVGVISDAVALSPLCDGVIFVIRHKFANKNQIRRGLQSLQSLNAKILGVVFNQFEIPKSTGKYYGYYRSYRYEYKYEYKSEAEQDQ